VPTVLLTGLVLVCLAAFSVAHNHGTVTRRRVERFARRQQLRVTPTNGVVAIRYLATTRRWRSSGLLIGGSTVALWSLRHGSLRINFLALFVGWFVGAVIAEWRVSTAATGTRRAASLTARRRSDYLGWAARWLPAIMVGATGLFAVGVLGYAAVRHASGSALSGAVLWTVLLAATVGVVAVVQRHILTRPQPVTEADLRAADDAVRGRSLHVLAGSTVAIAGYLTAALASVAGEVHQAAANSRGPASGLVTVAVLGYLVAPIAGALIANAPAPAARRAAGRAETPAGR
jgi:hypothetical protein